MRNVCLNVLDIKTLLYIVIHSWERYEGASGFTILSFNNVFLPDSQRPITFASAISAGVSNPVASRTTGSQLTQANFNISAKLRSLKLS